MNAVPRLALMMMFAATNIASADGSLTVRNTGQTGAELWIWPRSENRYRRPETFVAGGGGRASVDFRSGEIYWLVARDEQNREFPIDWVNIEKALIDNPGLELHIDRVLQTLTRDVRVHAYVWDCQRQCWIRETRIVRRVVQEEVLVPTWKAPVKLMTGHN